MVDGQPQGSDNYQFTYAPINGQQVTCRLTSSEICTSGNPADSDPITMSVKPIVITGTIHGPAGVLPVVTIQVTDASGNLFSPDKSTFTQTPTGEYTVTVSPEYDTTVTAQPVLAGYNFIGTAPENMGLDKGTYTHVIASITGQDYNAKPLDPKMFIIEGEIILKAMDMPLDKVILTLKGTLNGDPWPKDPPQYLQYVTGADGDYKFLVPEGWTGQVVAVKSLYSLYSVVPGFQASNFVNYSPVMQDWTRQDYMAESAVGTSVKIKIAGQIIPKPNEFGNLAAIRIYVVQNGKKFEVAKTDDTGHYVFEINAPFTGQVMPLHSDLAIRSTANINNSYRSYTAQAFSLDREDYYAMKRVGSPKTVAK
jgi:hypothetical protein